jgi:glycosyltransferase involved in cell wall biosynthesis
MRIGIDCVRIDPSYVGGLNTFTLGLLGGFATLSTTARFHLYVSEANQHVFEKFRNVKRFETRVIPERLVSTNRRICRVALLSSSSAFYKRISDHVFEGVRKSMESDADILYFPAPVLQFFNARKPTVLSMHDIQHVHHPEFFDWSRRLSRRITYGLSAQHATYFQASSDFIKRDLLEHFPSISPHQIEVIREGVCLSDFSAPISDSSSPTAYDLPSRYLLLPAQLWPHKNHVTVLKALKQIEKQRGLRIPLIMTGARFSTSSRIFDFIAKQQMNYVRYLGKVPFQDLRELYQRASLLVSASLHESSSLPVLEAAASGIPIVASRIPPNEELARTLQLNLFDPLSVDDLARVILSIWQDEQTASAQIEHNRERIIDYSWQSAAERFMQLFEKIINSPDCCGN